MTIRVLMLQTHVEPLPGNGQAAYCAGSFYMVSEDLAMQLCAVRPQKAKLDRLTEEHADLDPELFEPPPLPQPPQEE